MPVRKAMPASRAGQATLEFVVAFAGVALPLTFALIFTAQVLWIWHSVNDWTRQGAGYAATHCWESTGANVLDFIRSNVPPMIDQFEFQSQNGTAQIAVSYFSYDPATGLVTPFTCAGDCSSGCIPETVTIQVTGYMYRTFLATLGLPPITLPDFQTTVPMESAGCDPEVVGTCLP